jgi:hypothetical protein
VTGLHHVLGVIARTAALLLIAASAPAAAQAPAAASDAALQVFVRRVESYARLRQRLADKIPAFGARTDAIAHLVNRRYLAASIRRARSRATEGEVFTPDAADVFRSRLTAAPSVSGPLASRQRQTREAGSLTIQVNEPLREEQSDDVARAVLDALPPLPGGMEYRIVGSDLVLWDAQADVVVDVLRDAFRSPLDD